MTFLRGQSSFTFKGARNALNKSMRNIQNDSKFYRSIKGIQNALHFLIEVPDKE